MKNLKGIVLIFILLTCLWFSYRQANLARLFSFDYHYTFLADSFSHHRLWLNESLGEQIPGDLALFRGKYFVVWGPLPGILLIPSVALFGNNFPQNLLTIILSILLFWSIYKIAQKYSFNQEDSFWFGLFYIFGTVYISLLVINISAFQVQAISHVFLVLSLYEDCCKKRYFWIGFYLSLAIASRFTLIGGIIFFILSIYKDDRLRKEKFVKLILPVFGTVLLLAFYNLARFGNILETGYSFNITLPYQPMYEAYKHYGLFSFRYFFISLYYFLLKGPELIRSSLTNLPIFPYLKSDGWGLSLVVTSPLLFSSLFFLKIKRDFKELLTLLFILLPNLCFYSVGFAQFGYRYALDIYPFLLLILFKSFKGVLSFRYKLLILSSLFFNLFYMLSFWGAYPF